MTTPTLIVNDERHNILAAVAAGEVSWYPAKKSAAPRCVWQPSRRKGERGTPAPQDVTVTVTWLRSYGLAALSRAVDHNGARDVIPTTRGRETLG